MNNITLYVYIASIQSQATTDNNIKASGKCAFKFRNRQIYDKEIISFQCYGHPAESLLNAGAGSELFVNGRVNIFKPDKDSNNPNPTTLLTIQKVFCITSASSSSGEVPTAETTTISEDDSTTTIEATVVNHTTDRKPKRELATVVSNEQNLDEIPF